MLSQKELHELRRAAEAAWDDSTRHPAHKGHPCNGFGQCLVTSAWLASMYGGHVGVKNGHYFHVAEDGQTGIDLVGDHRLTRPEHPSVEGQRLDPEDEGVKLAPHHRTWRTSPMRQASTDDPHFAGYHPLDFDLSTDERVQRFVRRAGRLLEASRNGHRLALDVGDAYPAEEPQYASDHAYEADDGFLHDEPGYEPQSQTYNFVYGNGQLHLSHSHEHTDLAKHGLIDPDGTGPFAAGFVTVEMDKANWQVRSNIGLHALERVFKDYGKKVGWDWGGMTDVSGQPVSDDFAPKKSQRFAYVFDPEDNHLYMGTNRDMLWLTIAKHATVDPKMGNVTVDGYTATFHGDTEDLALHKALREWADDEGYRVAGDNVLRRLEDLEQGNIWSPSDNEPEGTQFFHEPKPDRNLRGPGGVFKCDKCWQIFPSHRLYLQHEQDEHLPQDEGVQNAGLGMDHEPNGGTNSPFGEMSDYAGNHVACMNTTAKQASRYAGFEDIYSGWYVAYRGGGPVGALGVGPDGNVTYCSGTSFGVTDALLRYARQFEGTMQYEALGEDTTALRRVGFVEVNRGLWKWSDENPSQALQGSIPFIFDVEKDNVTVGHPGERHSDIQGHFTPAGIVEGTYEPGGKVLIKSITNMPYTVRHMLELWYYQHPELEVKSVHLRDDAGQDTKLAHRTAMPHLDYTDDIRAEREPGFHEMLNKTLIDPESVGTPGIEQVPHFEHPDRSVGGHPDFPRSEYTNFVHRNEQGIPTGVLNLYHPFPEMVNGEPIPGPGPNGKSWVLDDTAVAVHPDHRRQGVARALIEHVNNLGWNYDHWHERPGARTRTFTPGGAALYQSLPNRTSKMEVGQYISSMVSQDETAYQATQALQRAGGSVYAVGGCIRDALMDRTPKDIDLMVCGIPAETVEKALRALPGSMNLTGKDFGVFRYKRFNDDPGEVEIAMPRSERSTGAGHKDFDVQVDHTMSPEEDLYRRDFTPNAMAVDLQSGRLVDPFGGADDIRNGKFSTLSERSLSDDPLRTVRGLVMHSRFGFEPDDDTRAQMRANAEGLRHLPAERIQAELDKLFASPNPEKGIELAHQTGTLEHIFPEVAAAHGYNQNNPHHEQLLYDHLLSVMKHVKAQGGDPDLALAGLLHDIGKPASRWSECKNCGYSVHGEQVDCPECGHKMSGHFYKLHDKQYGHLGDDHETVGAEMAENRMRRLKYPKERIDRVKGLIQHHMYPAFSSSKGARKFLNRVGDHADDLQVLRIADQGGKKAYMTDPTGNLSVDKERQLVAEVRASGQATTVKSLAISGKDLMAAGMKPGPHMGEVLRYLTDEVVEDPAVNTRDKLIQMALAYVPQKASSYRWK